jgi:hypothetical protein
MSICDPREDIARIEAAAVIATRNLELSRAVVELHGDSRRLGMSERIRYRFARNREEPTALP